MFSRSVYAALQGPEHADARAEYDATRAGMRAAYQPQGPVEELMVERLAAQFWLLDWLQAQKIDFLLTDPDEWNPIVGFVERSQPFAVEESRISRDVSRILRDLEFLQRWRTGGLAPHPRRAPEPAVLPPTPTPDVPPDDPLVT